MVKKKQTKERTWELSKQRECLWTRGWPSEEELPQAKHLLIRQKEFQTPAAGGESTQGLYGNEWAVSCRTREPGAQRSLLRKWEGSGDIWASSSNPDSLRPLVIVLILQVFLPFCLILLTSPFLPLALILCNEHSLFQLPGNQRRMQESGNDLGRTLDFDVSLLLVMDWMLPSLTPVMSTRNPTVWPYLETWS